MLTEVVGLAIYILLQNSGLPKLIAYLLDTRFSLENVQEGKRHLMKACQWILIGKCTGRQETFDESTPVDENRSYGRGYGCG